jgi:xanthine dehydrogenase small subunit
VDQPIRFILNHDSIESYLPPGTVVLDLLRRDRRLTGTKEVCREGDCGACAVLLGQLAGHGEPILEYRVVNSCLLPLGDIAGKHLVSIEGLNRATLTPVQQQLVDHGAIQCGFCTPGFVISLTGYLLRQLSWSFQGAVDAVAGNICRCTGYASIKRAIVDLLAQLEDVPDSVAKDSSQQPRLARLQALVERRVVPEYFLDIPSRLQTLRQARSWPPAVRPRRILHQGSDGQTVVAGGTDLFVQKADQLLENDLRFVSQAPELRRIHVADGRLYLGAATVMEEVAEIPEINDRLPQLASALPLVASLPIRNRATLGGNIVNASPIGDFTVMLLAIGAVLGLNNGKTIREVPLQRFYLGYKQLDLKEGERLEWIALPLEEGSFSFEKVSRRRNLDIASVNSAAWISSSGGGIESLRLVAGGVAPIPLYLARGSAFLQGRGFSVENLEQALELVQGEISPISDVRGSEQYKRLLLRQLLVAHFQKFFPERIRAEVWT